MNMRTKGIFKVGMNVNGMLRGTQLFPDFPNNEIIRERDFERLAEWGFDHVRLPMHDNMYMHKEFEFDEANMSYMDDYIYWANKYGLDAMIDAHDVPWYRYAKADTERWEENTLLRDPESQEKYCEMWRLLTRRYKGTEDSVAFELINEVVYDEVPNGWNIVAHKAIKAIREKEKQRKIVYGSLFYNNTHKLKEIDVLKEDDNIIYNFHFYLPQLFTHQHALYSNQNKPYIKLFPEIQIDYPGYIPGVEEYIKAAPKYEDSTSRYINQYIDKNFMEMVDLAPVIEFIKKHQKPVYCGEFGVIRYAPRQSKIKWLKDFISLMNKYNIGRAYWAYKNTQWGVIDPVDNSICDNEVIDILSSVSPNIY